MVSLILIQFVVVLLTALLLGWAFRRIGQFAVIGEMVGGLLLGPSLLGRFCPKVSSFIFPVDQLESIHTLSLLGVWLFIFLVGVELDLARLRAVGRTALITSQTSIILPFALGACFSALLYPKFAGAGVPFLAFAIFIGAAMSITAFPVLARILKERELSHTDIGVIAITCAAIDDVTAWCILAVMIVVAQPFSSASSLGMRFGALAAYIAVMVLAVRPLLRLWEKRRTIQRLSDDVLSVCLIALFVSCATTQAIGVHGLFGAFLFGLVLPKPAWLVEGLVEKLEPITTNLLLPFFFVYTGLRTNINLIAGPVLWMYCVGILGIAVLGKIAGATLPLRLMKHRWREAWAVGVLMNTRGLMELVILNIGLELHILSPTLFSMMVLMALFTTFMTGPLLGWILRPEQAIAEDQKAICP